MSSSHGSPESLWEEPILEELGGFGSDNNTLCLSGEEVGEEKEAVLGIDERGPLVVKLLLILPVDDELFSGICDALLGCLRCGVLWEQKRRHQMQ